MNHPFYALSQSNRKALFWCLLGVTLAWMVLMQAVGEPLINSTAPAGIVTFELAGNTTTAQEILASWDQQTHLFAALGLGLDYVFMLLYSTTIGLGCIMAGDALRGRGWPLAGMGAPLAWGQWVAAVLDAFENLALSLVLVSSLAAPWPELARWCAIGKFLLIFLGLAYAFYGLCATLAGKVLHRA